MVRTKRYKTKFDASREYPLWTISDKTGKGAAMDLLIADSQVINPVYVDLKGVSERNANFGSDKKIRLAGGSMEYCQKKLEIVKGNDNHPYLFDMVWVDRRDRIWSLRVNLTKCYQAFNHDKKAFNIRKHGKYMDFEVKFKSLCTYTSTGNKSLDIKRHHEKVLDWMLSVDCARPPQLIDLNESWKPLL